MPVVKVRAKDLHELAEGAAFLFRTRPIDMDERARSLLDSAAIEVLDRAARALGSIDEWCIPALEVAMREVAAAAGVDLGNLPNNKKKTLTGRSTSPGIFDVLVLLGRTESLARLADRVVALGGRMEIESPLGRGTTVRAAVPSVPGPG